MSTEPNSGIKEGSDVSPSSSPKVAHTAGGVTAPGVPTTLMVEVSALTAQIAAVATSHAADEMRKAFARNPALTDLRRAGEAQERASKELQAAVDRAVRS